MMLSEQAVISVLTTIQNGKKTPEQACALRGINFDIFLRFMEVGLLEQAHIQSGGAARKKNAPNLWGYMALQRVLAGGEAVANIEH